MDFGSLLYAAQKNEKSAHKEIKCYKTKFEPPKKEAKPKANLSANIQKYLQKRDEEEKRKAEEERRKKEELLVLRSQDRKSFKRVQTMLKRTKSANKSVMEDAIDDVNTAVTMNGPQQCDEDDYGYVSQEATAFYAKLMDKYSSMPPEEPKFPQGKKPVVKDLNAAKDRVRAALQKEEEEELLPHKRKRKSKSDKPDEENEESNKEEERSRKREHSPVEEPKPKKPRKMAPPPMDFSSLLKLAEQKQFEPVKIEKNVTEDETHRPMTKKQRLEYERELESRQRRMERERAREGQRQPDSSKRIPKISDRPNEERKEKPNGLGRIPKKSDTVDNRMKSESLNGDYIKKDSFETKNHLKSKPIPKTTNDRSTNSHQPERNNHKMSQSESRNKITPPNDRRPESVQKSYDRRSEPLHNSYDQRPSHNSIAQNKIKSRNHIISDEERSATSGSENERSKKPSSSTGKSRILKSLFEASDDESEFSNHDSSRTQRDFESNKYKPSHDLERHKKTYEETKFKIPKGNSKSDLDRRKDYESSDKKNSSEKSRPSSFDETKFKMSKGNSKSDLDRRKDYESLDRLKSLEKSRSSSNSSSKPEPSRDKYKSNEPRSDKPQLDSKSLLDKNRSPTERLKDRSSTTKKDTLVENAKKTSSQSAEEVLKKSADVWSKPCNLPPSTAPARAPGGLSESQIQRLREMNKKPSASRPPQMSKPTSSFERSSDGRPLQSRSGGPLQGKPNMLKAAAAASAARAASQNSQSSRDQPSPKPERQSFSEKQSSTRPPLSSNKSRELDKDSRSKQVALKDERPKQFPPKDLKPKQFPPSDLKPRSFPPKDVRPRQFPPADVRPRQFPPSDIKRKPKPRRIIDDDSEEYDSEMDDFIDDGTDMDTETISKEIQTIFGYDKNRYIGLDDDECLESNFGRIDREEMRSLQIGAQEDWIELEKDMRQKKRMKEKRKQLLMNKR